MTSAPVRRRREWVDPQNPLANWPVVRPTSVLFETYADWKRWHLADEDAGGFVHHRRARCGKVNIGQEGCIPRCWLKVPRIFDPAHRSGARSFRIAGLICERCAPSVTPADSV